jgi:hypothetical protein
MILKELELVTKSNLKLDELNYHLGLIELKLLEENCLVILLIDDIYIDTNLTEFSTLQED